jgi:hypothetical protein
VTRERRIEAGVFAALAAAALLTALLVPTYPNYDSYYHLVWGRELLDGMKPGFEAYAAPTEHPLFLALCTALAGVFGDHADRALVLVCVLSLVALVWAVYRVGAACFGRWPGVGAAVFCGSSFALGLYAVRGYVDVPFLAVVLWAAALEAERPRRGASVALLLAVAGLLRPEAWILAGLYWLWCGPIARRRALGPGELIASAEPSAAWLRWRLDLLLLAAAAPVLWATCDAVVTGDPLFSLHATSGLAENLGRERGLSHVPRSFVSFLADTARPPVFLAGLLGLALAWRERSRLRALHVPMALFAAGALTFVGTGVAGLSILPRYLTVPTIALMIFAGYAVLGFTRLRAGRVRTLWARAAVAAAVIGAAFFVVKLDAFSRLATELRFIRTTHRDLVAVLDTPAVQRARSCGPVTLPNYRLVPDTRWILAAGRRSVGARSAQRHSRGVALFLVGTKPLKRFGFADGATSSTNAPDPGFAPVARRGMFSAYGACG